MRLVRRGSGAEFHCRIPATAPNDAVNGFVWTCARDPLFDFLSLPLNPCVILLIAFLALNCRARGEYAADSLASLLWRVLLKTAVGLGGFFLFWACLIRFAFQIDPALLLKAVPFVWSIAGWIVAGLTWRRWKRAGATAQQRRPGLMTVRWVIPCVLAFVLVRPLIPNTNLLLSAPYKLFEWPLALTTNFIASDECLASRVIEYGSSHGIAEIIGEPARNELKFRGRAAVAGMATTLYDSLDLDAISPSFYRRHYNPVWEPDGAVSDYMSRAQYGISFLLAQVGTLGGRQPVLYAWKTRAPSEELRNMAASILTCIRIGRQSLIDKATGPGCALPGEYCENDKCYKVFGEHCGTAAECFSATCEHNTCCQPLGQACDGSECCFGSTCSMHRCTSQDSNQQKP